jgi:hypothetical protein
MDLSEIILYLSKTQPPRDNGGIVLANNYGLRDKTGVVLANNDRLLANNGEHLYKTVTAIAKNTII